MSSLLHIGKKTILNGPKFKNFIKTTVGEFCFTYCDRFSDRICQIDASLDENNQETYSSVKIRSVRLALELQNRGLSSRDVVVLFTKVTLDTIIPILACFYLGTKVVNLDPQLSPKERAHLLRMVSPTMIFVEREYVPPLEESVKIANLKTDLVVFGQSIKYPIFDHLVRPKPQEDKFKPVKANVNDTIIMFFGFGSGSPNAICHSHHTLLNAVQSFYETGYTCDCLLYAGSFYRLTSWILLFCTFLSGGQRIFYRNAAAENIFRMIQRYKVSCLCLTPLISYSLTKFENSSNYDISSVEFVILTGTPISADQYYNVSTLFSKSTVTSAYDLKETGVVTLFNPRKDNELIESKPGSSGKLAFGIIAKIVDTNTNEPVTAKKVGEIRVKSEIMMKGYYNADSTTAFDKNGFLKTGDLAYFDEDECFYILDRISEVFKYLSFRITPATIENVLMQHPAVKEAVVFGIPTEDEGEIPTATVVLKENSRATEKELEDFVAAQMTDRYKLRGGVQFATELPKNTGHLKSIKSIEK